MTAPIILTLLEAYKFKLDGKVPVQVNVDRLISPVPLPLLFAVVMVTDVPLFKKFNRSVVFTFALLAEASGVKVLPLNEPLLVEPALNVTSALCKL